MVRCELCGTETTDPRQAKIEGAELTVCSDCRELGTEVSSSPTDAATETETTSKTTPSDSTEQSRTQSPTQPDTTTSAATDSTASTDVGPRSLAPDYADRLRTAREQAGLSQADLADKINEKASLISKLERGEMQPTERVQTVLEQELDISLSATGDATTDVADRDETDLTLGDVVEFDSDS